MITLARSQVTSYRLNRHHLRKRAPRQSLVKAVSDVCGIQAQLSSSAELELWARVEELRREDSISALWEERTLVKAWCMRGAAHLLAAIDFPVFVGGLRRRGLHRERQWIKRYGIAQAEMDAMVRAVVDALDDDILTRRELANRVVAKLGSKAKPWVEHTWGGVVKLACLEGHVCFGPSRGSNITFVRRTTWLPDVEDLPVEEAETTLFQRYLHGYGPASLGDFAYWAGVTVRDAESIKERTTEKLVEVKTGDKTALMLRGDLSELLSNSEEAKEEASVRLLPSFDCFLLGHRNKSDLVDEAHYRQVYRKAGWLSPVVLLNGQVKGLWRYKKQRKHLHIVIEPFRTIPKDVRTQIREEANSLARFYDTSCQVSYAD